MELFEVDTVSQKEPSSDLFEMDVPESEANAQEVLSNRKGLAPEQAAKALDYSQKLDVTPDFFADNESEFTESVKTLDNEFANIVQGKVTKDYASLSPVHADLISQDFGKMSSAEKVAKNFREDVWDVQFKQRRLNELTRTRMMTGGKFEDPALEEEAKTLRSEISQMGANTFGREVGDTEQFGVDVAKGLTQFGTTFWENKKLTASLIGLGATVGTGLGAFAGSSVPLIGTAAGALAGAKTGAGFGAKAALILSPAWDGMLESSAEIYDQFDNATDKEGNKVFGEMDHERKLKIAAGVGLVNGIGDTALGYVLGKAVPYLNKFKKGPNLTKFLASSPKTLATMEILGNISKGFLAEGSTEAAQSMYTNFSKQLAMQRPDEDGFHNFVKAFSETVTNPENWWEAGYEGVIGGTVGGGITAATTVPFRNKLTTQYGQMQEAISKSGKVLETENAFMQIVAMTKDASMKNVAPGEFNKVFEKIFENSNLGNEFYFNLTDLRALSSDPEKGAIIAQKLANVDPEVIRLAQQFGVDISLPASDTLNLVMEYPESLGMLRTEQGGQSTGEVRGNVKTLLESLKQFEGQGDAVLSQLEGMSEVDPAMLEELSSVFQNATDTFTSSNRKNYMSQPVVEDTDLESQVVKPEYPQKPVPPENNDGSEVQKLYEQEIADYEKIVRQMDEDYNAAKVREDSFRNITGKKTLSKFDKDLLSARMELDQELVDDVNTEVNKERDVAFQTETEKQIAERVNTLERETSITESYANPSLDSITDKGLLEHKKKGYSPFAIDPRSLSEAQRAIYYDDNSLTPSMKINMKKRKVFVEGGIHINEAAQLQGFENGEQLLEVLAKTPSKKQIQKSIENDGFSAEQNRRRIKDQTESDRLKRIDDKYTNVSKLRLKELEVMKDTKWATTKGVFVKIAKRLKSFKEYRDSAENVINNVPINTLNKSLNPKTWRRREIDAHNEAQKNLSKGEFEASFDNKEKSLQTIELERAATLAQKQNASNLKFFRRSKNKGFKNTLEKTGFKDAFDSIVQATGMDGEGVKVNTVPLEDFSVKMEEAGITLPPIPEVLYKGTESYEKLTTIQLQEVTDYAKAIYHQAQMENKYFTQMDKNETLETKEALAEKAKEQAESHPFYNPEKAKTKEPTTQMEGIKNGVKTALGSIKSLKSIISDLDFYESKKFFYDVLNLDRQRQGKRIEIREIDHHDESVIKRFFGSVDKWKKEISLEYLSIPEFADFSDIMGGNKEIRRIDLYSMVAHLGDTDGRKNLTNYKNSKDENISFGTILKVLERELTPNEVAFVQEFMVNRFDRFTERSQALNKKITGIDMKMIEGVEYTLHGKVIPGGYFPQKYKPLSDDVKAQKQLEKTLDKKADKGDFFAARRAAEKTYQGRQKERTGSSRSLDLSFENIFESTEEFLQDLHFRERGIDLFKFLNDPENIISIKSVIGDKGYTRLFNHVQDSISKASEKDIGVFKEEKSLFDRMMSHVNSLHAVQAITYNLTSAGIQLDSLANLTMRGNAKTAIYLGNTVRKVISDIGNLDRYIELAAKINPDVLLEMDGIDDNVKKGTQNFMPITKGFFSNYKKGDKLSTQARVKEFQRKMNDVGFEPLRKADMMNRVFATLALSEQFTNGDLDVDHGWTLDKIKKMDDEKQFKTMQSIVKNITDLSLTDQSREGKSALEKISGSSSNFVRYFGDRRQRLNTKVAQAEKIRGAVKRKDYKKAVGYTMTAALSLGVAKAWMKALRDDDESIVNQLKNVEGGQDLLDIAGSGVAGLLTSPISSTMDEVPVLDNLAYLWDGLEKGFSNGQMRPLSTPATQVMSTGLYGLWQMSQIFGAAIDQVKEGEVDLEALSPSRKKREAIINTLGYGVSFGTGMGVPTGVLNKVVRAIENESDDTYIRETAIEIKDTFISVKKLIEQMFPEDEGAKLFVSDMDEALKTIPLETQASTKNLIPENIKEFISSKLSNGKWNKVDPSTGAVGIYQFTEEQWQYISASDPSLGLTENGRVSKDPSEQTVAMNWLLQKNTQVLRGYDLEVNEENLLGAHIFGGLNMVNILVSNPKASLVDTIGEQAKKPVFKNFSTVGSVKSYLSNEVKNLK